MMRESRGRQFYLGLAAKCMVFQPSDFQLPPLYFSSLVSLCSVLSQSFSLTSLVVFSRHLSNVHAMTSSNSASPDLGHYLPRQAHFLNLFLKGTLLFFFLKEVIFDTKSLSILFHWHCCFCPSFFLVFAFIVPVAKILRLGVNTVVSWSFILRLSSSGIFLLSSPTQILMFPKVMLHLHWTLESPLPPWRVSYSTLHNMLWAPWWPLDFMVASHSRLSDLQGWPECHFWPFQALLSSFFSEISCIVRSLARV